MNQTIQTRKAFTCFDCGEEITFRGSKTKYNVDGSRHVCNEEKRQAYSGSKQKKTYTSNSNSARWWRWYWGYGPGRYHKDNEKRYSSEDYQNRRKQAEEQRRQYRERYASKTTVDTFDALETLGLTAEVLKLGYEKRIQTIKDAFRKLALRFHPDRKPEGSHEKFIEINTAYEVLTQ